MSRTSASQYEWRWRNRGPRKAGHLFDGTCIRPRSLCGQIWSYSFSDTDEDWHTPLSPQPGSKVCSKCERQYQELLFGEKTPTPPKKSEPFELTDHQRALCLVEYEAQLILQTQKHGPPTMANARAVLMGAARMAARTGVGLSEFVKAAATEWQMGQKERTNGEHA